MVISRRTERSMVRAMCGVKLMDRKNTKELMDTLGLQDTMDKSKWGTMVYGHVLRRNRTMC